jgi:hypothetical protein
VAAEAVGAAGGESRGSRGVVGGSGCGGGSGMGLSSVVGRLPASDRARGH